MAEVAEVDAGIVAAPPVPLEKPEWPGPSKSVYQTPHLGSLRPAQPGT